MTVTEERIYRALSWVFLVSAAIFLVVGKPNAVAYCAVALALFALIRAGRLEREVKALRATSGRNRT